MSGETLVTLNGRLTQDPELRFIPSGAGVASFTVAVNARKFNKQTNEWEKKPAKFWRCEAWNSGQQVLAENVAEVLRKGDSVIVYGEVETREYTTKEGEKRSVDQVRVDTIGKDLRWHNGNSAKAPEPASNSQGWGQQPTADP